MTGDHPPYDIRLIDYRDISHPEAGGAERYLYEVFSRLAHRGHRVRLLASTYPGAAATEELDGISVERRGNRASFNFVALAACRRWSRNGDGDVVVENLCKIPFFTHRLGGGIPSLAIVHHLFGNTVYQETNLLAGTYVRAYEALLPIGYRGAHLVAVSKSTSADLITRGICLEPVELVPNGLHTDQLCPKPGVEPGPQPRLIYLGRLKRYKRIDLLIRAAARLRTDWPGLEVEIVGRGDHLGKLRQLVEELGLNGCVSFPGFVSEDEKLDRLRRAHALVYTSPKEGWGIGAIEASACGVPVVASDSPGLSEAVLNEETGLLVPHGDLHALTAALDRLLRDPSLRDRLGTSGVEWASQFSWDTAADQMECILDTVIQEQRKTNAD
ncbi:MAG: hypothetical protein DRJ65_03750 [Acidobacteria bacterium]|nr:MAG: hypothetical protein DRJ65_03750 [Acidobacteriota bacterium]